ncbi:hypothetical protein GS502_15135 [Rhodococcus hoagii]|nr:hypothetical protein [Prescottella equi]
MAALHARRAVSLIGSNDALDLMDQAVSTGASIELLVKATLADVNVHLIRANTARELDTTLALSGHPKMEGRLPVLKTIGGSEGFTLLTRCQERLGISGPQVHVPDRCKVFTVRDSAVHLGIVDRDETDEAVTEMVKMTKNLLDLRKRFGQTCDWSQYWDDQQASADQIQQRAAAALSTAFQQNLSVARRIFNQRWTNPTRDKNLIQLLEQSRPRHDRDQKIEQFACPACEHQGWVTYDVERSEPDVTQETQCDAYWVVRLTGYPRDFDCQVCELFLDDPEELAEAGIEVADLGEDEASQDEIDDFNNFQWMLESMHDD